MNNLPELNFDPSTLKRELKRHYISASEEELDAMMEAIGEKNLSDLFSHIDGAVQMNERLNLPEELSYKGLAEAMASIAEKNPHKISFLGDALADYKQNAVVAAVCEIRNLTTSYTAYQPERSQGTLISHWIYQCLMRELTGFEAINASMYERSTALFEGICCAIRLMRKGTAVVISEGIFPQDREVIETLARDTEIRIEWARVDKASGQTDVEHMRSIAEGLGDELAGIGFMQVNSLGIIDRFDEMADMGKQLGVKTIGIIDPMQVVPGGLKTPAEWGETGVDILVGEAQHMAIRANFGGPGLGLFGVRFNESVKNDVRHTPGRFIGEAKDSANEDAYVMVLSTREQHIRKEKATSNICSNQAFLATAAGAAMLAKGSKGLQDASAHGRDMAGTFAKALGGIKGASLMYPDSTFYNEVLVRIEGAGIDELIDKGSEAGMHVGVDMTERVGTAALKVAFTDLQTREDLDALIALFKRTLGESDGQQEVKTIEDGLKRRSEMRFPEITQEEVIGYYEKLGALNVSPDFTCYPLGSCTMKYNPHINDWAAGLEGFTQMHPQAPLKDAQGCLEVLHETQEWFKEITGLAGLTTQPVAGAQGELVGIKLFQAYHRDRGEGHRRKILIPKSAHGTNFATAVMAGMDAKSDIVLLDADATGQIDMGQLDEALEKHGAEVCGIMITNPNTSGIFEKHFKEIADKVHKAGGLVYMDGANMNAIAGWVDLGKLGVDAVHNNLHKTWTIPHGGGGPGDAIVAVSECLVEFLPGVQVIKNESGEYSVKRPSKSIGSFHRHWGNFAHKVRCLTYLKRLGAEGVKRMSAVAVLASRYLKKQLEGECPTLPTGAESTPRMHEFIITPSEALFEKLAGAGITRVQAAPRLGKVFLDYGFHAPTVAFPEPLGLMIEPTESYTKGELDKLAEAIRSILRVGFERPEYLQDAPSTTPIRRVDEVQANRQLCLSQPGPMELPKLEKLLERNQPVHEETVEAIERAILSGSAISVGTRV